MNVRPAYVTRVSIALALLLTTYPSARAQGVDGAAGPAVVQAKPAPKSFTTRLGIAAQAVVPGTVLPAPDVTALLAEDELAAGKGDKSMRTGVSRELRVRFSDGRWDALPGSGWLWRVEVGSKAAVGVRAHLTALDLPEGARVQFLGSDGAIAGGPFQAHGPTGDGQLWSPVVPGERMVIECFIPGDAGGAAPAIEPFQVDAVMHNYRGPFDPAFGALAPLEGTCHNDVTCYSAWASLTHAVARIDYVESGTGYICTGQLLNTLAGDLQPYFLTANHCVHSAGAAASAILYWDFQTATCGGAVPALGSSPTSSVCSLLSNNAASDYSLLMVLGTLPGGRFWAGWQAADPTDGTLVACVHHPTGAYKRISFGTKATTPTADHIRSNWYSGVTEPGSSGSGLFRQDTQRLVGQLHGGPSVCGGTTLNDDYGSFQSTYPNISGFLASGSDDGFEPNDVCASATGLGNGSWGGLVVRYGHDDWYSLFVPAGQRVTVGTTFTNAYGDIDMEMTNGCGGTYLTSSTGTGDAETVDWYNTTGAAQTVKVHVYLYSNTRNAYSLSAYVGPFPNLNAAYTPSGFSWPAVPRKTGDAGLFNAVLPATLDGNAGDTWVNWAIQNEGPGTTPEAWESRLYIDGDFYSSFGIGPNNPGAFSWQALNVGPTVVRGGRHMFTSYADYNNTVLESTKADNVWTGQWIWSPLPVGDGSPLLRPAPPVVGPYSQPNTDAFQFDRPASFAWVTAVAPTVAGDDYDLRVYSDYAGSLSGFSTVIGGSAYGSTYTDFVVGNYSGTPTTLYPAAVRFAAGTAATLDVDQSSAAGRNGSGPHVTWPNQLMTANRLVDVYEAYLLTGVTYHFALTRNSGSSVIHAELFSGAAGTITGRGAGLAISGVADASHDLMVYTPVTTGWHPLVVVRDQGVGANNDVNYTLEWGDGTTLDVPGADVAHYALEFLGPQPNPIRAGGHVSFTLSDDTQVRLSLFDLGGRRVSVLADRVFAAGRHDVPWNGRSDSGRAMETGVYWVRMEAAGREFTRRLVLIQ